MAILYSIAARPAGQIEQWENKIERIWYRAIKNDPERCNNQKDYHLSNTRRHIVQAHTVFMFSSLPAIAKCLARTPNMTLHMLERISEMLREGKVLCEVKIWGTERA